MPGRRASRHVILAGTGARARAIAAALSDRAEIVGYVDDTPRHEDLERIGDAYLGKLSDLREIACSRAVSELVLALPRSELLGETTSNTFGLCEVLGLDLTIPVDLYDTRATVARPGDVPGYAAVTLGVQRRPRLALAVKRLIDIVGASLGLLFTAPLWVLSSVAIKLDSRGPVLFRQERLGLHGEPFDMYKFRTMSVDAEDRLEEVAALNEQTGPVFKVTDDPRVTWVGSILRRYSIDELPQLLNVLRGEMSLVGPRPPLAREVTRYQADHRGRLAMRPGLTCLWQVSGRNQIGFEDWVRLDLEYMQRWSLTLDLLILLETVPAVLKGRGAS